MANISASKRDINSFLVIILIAVLSVIICLILKAEAFEQQACEKNLVEEAPNAVWSSSAGRLPFGSSRDDPRGFAIYRKKVYVEGYLKVDETMLETHPRWEDSPYRNRGRSS